MIFFGKIHRLSKRSHGEESLVKWKEQYIHKEPSSFTSHVDGISVFTVNGKAVRNTCDSDFIEGGNGYRFTRVTNCS